MKKKLNILEETPSFSLNKKKQNFGQIWKRKKLNEFQGEKVQIENKIGTKIVHV